MRLKAHTVFLTYSKYRYQYEAAKHTQCSLLTVSIAINMGLKTHTVFLTVSIAVTVFLTYSKYRYHSVPYSQ